MTVVDPVFQGETYATVLRSQLGASFTATATGKLRKVIGANPDVMESAVAATFTVSSYAGDSEYGDGFAFSLTEAQTAALTPGLYRANAAITFTAPGSTVEKTEHWLIDIKESAT